MSETKEPYQYENDSDDPTSSKGRTSDFGSDDGGSNPSVGAAFEQIERPNYDGATYLRTTLPLGRSAINYEMACTVYITRPIGVESEEFLNQVIEAYHLLYEQTGHRPTELFLTEEMVRGLRVADWVRDILKYSNTYVVPFEQLLPRIFNVDKIFIQPLSPDALPYLRVMIKM